MKRHFKTKINGKPLTLGLTFETSLNILDEVASPTQIMNSVIMDNQAQMMGRARTGDFRLTERNVIEILEIANRDHEGLDQKALGELVFQHGYIQVFAIIVEYLTEMVSSYSSDDIEAVAEDEEKKEGN